MLNLNPDEKRKKDESLEKIKNKRGQIITWGLEIEELLEGVLTNYFMRYNQKKEKTQFFEVEVMREMSFGFKIELFKKILKQEKYDESKLEKIMPAIKNILEMRNKAAHWRNVFFLQRAEVKLRKKNETLSDEMLSLSDEMLKKLEEDKEYAFQEIISFHKWSWDKELNL